MASLASAFLAAGAQSVVACLWKVPDAETREFMKLFYANLHEQHDVAEALTITQRILKKSYLPRVWAAFTVAGSWGK